MANTANSRVRIAVDVGNSSIKVGALDTGDSSFRTLRLAPSGHAWSEPLSTFLLSVIPAGGNARWMFASVNSVAAKTLEDWISAHRSSDSVMRISRSNLTIQTNIRNPDAVGIDRLLAASMAYRLADCTAAIVIDAGTTVTIDLVDSSGTFCGGAILPGLGLQFAALHNATDRLPRLTPPNVLTDLESPGRDTAAAMQLGVVGGLLGAIDRIMASFRNSDATLFVTGGDADRLSPVITRQHRTVHDLPLLGLHELEIETA